MEIKFFFCHLRHKDVLGIYIYICFLWYITDVKKDNLYIFESVNMYKFVLAFSLFIVFLQQYKNKQNKAKEERLQLYLQLIERFMRVSRKKIHFFSP